MMNGRGYVALVCRISEDKSGRVEGNKAQEKWGRAYAAATWPGVPVRVFADNNISASNGDHRPEFEAFRAALAGGEVAHVWAVEQSRLERREAEWFTLAAELDAAGIAELHTKRDGIVRVRDTLAGIKAVLNAGEIRELKKRVNDKLDIIAEAGRPSGSRPFGYQHGKDATGAKTLHIVQAEADIIREAADRLLSGWSLTNIARDLRARGVHGPFLMKVTASGKRYTRQRADLDPALTVDGTPVDDGGVAITRPGAITANSVRSWLTSPTVAGQRVHRGIMLGAGNWAPIIDVDTFAAVRNKLAGPRLVSTSDGGTYLVPAKRVRSVRRYLLSGGVAVCAVCGAPLVGAVKQRRSKAADKALMRSVPYYSCHPKSGGRGCVGIVGELLETFVVGELLDELDRPAFRDALAADTMAEQRDRITSALRSVDVQRNDLARMWAARELNVEEWRTARSELAEQEGHLRAELAAVPAPLSHVDPALIREGWEAMTLDEQREIVSLFVERVVVKRAVPGTQGFDPDRVAIEWRRVG